MVDDSLAGVRVIFDDAYAPMIYASGGQIAAVVPYSVADKTETVVQVEYHGIRSNSVTLPVVTSFPGIFALDSTGKGQGAILNQDYNIDSSEKPAVQGSVVMIYATGEGQTDPSGVDGKLAAEPLPKPRLPVSVKTAGSMRRSFMPAGHLDWWQEFSR